MVFTPMKWIILAPFFSSDARWLDDFCDRPDLEFKKIFPENLAGSWHSRGSVTPLDEWLAHIRHVRKGMRESFDGVITCFPPLAFVAAIALVLLRRKDARLIAWNFNLGSLDNKKKGQVAGLILRRVDRFVVHARSEISSYSAWLNIDPSKFVFVPLSGIEPTDVRPSPIEGFYIVAMGSANRDYRTLVEAVRGSGIKTIIIAKKSELDELDDLPNLVKLSGLSRTECFAYMKGAAINVVPVKPTDQASGQVTLITSMFMGVPTIVTECPGAVDYICHDETGLLVRPKNHEALRSAILSLRNDQNFRQRLADSARRYALEHLSDPAAGRNLAQVIDDVVRRSKQ